MAERDDAPRMAQRLALWADQLRDISAMGAYFADNPYDKEHYRKVQEIAMALMAFATSTSLEEMEPLRAPIFSRPTPVVGSDAAVVDDDGAMLLIRRADNGCWAMPGGALDVGETPAEGAAREALEETGIRCEPVGLVGVFDSRLCGTVSRHHIYHFVFLCRPLNRGAAEAVIHPQETQGSGWFTEADLPAPLDPGHANRIPHAFRVWRGDPRSFFDR